MKIKYSPVVYVCVLYLLLSAYLIFSYMDFYQYLKGIAVIDLTPIAYVMLTFSIALMVLALFSIFRIPVFHYLFKMLHLWIVIVLGMLAGLQIKYGSMLWNSLSTNAEHTIAKAFPGADPKIFQPLVDLVQTSLRQFKDHLAYILLIIAIVVIVIQVILYLPSSLRYVYHTHISPFRYTLKHVFVSTIILAILLFSANFYMKLDSGVNPKLESLLALETKPVNDKANAFYPMLTIWMPDVADRTAAGKQWVMDYREMLAYFRKQNKPVKIAAYPKYRKIYFQGMSPADQAEINQIYIRRLREKNYKTGKDIQKYVERYRISLNVLHSLYAYKDYQNPLKYTGESYTDSFKNYEASLLVLHRLNLLVGLIENNEVDKSLIKNSFTDFIFDLVVIKNSTDPANKMLFTDKLSITLDFLNTLLQDPAYQNSIIYKPIGYLPILDKAALDYSKIARSRLVYFKSQFDGYTNSVKNSSIAENVFDYTFKYNRTLNCIYNNLNRELNLDNKMALAHLKAQQAQVLKPRLTNMIGDMICGVSTPEYESNYLIKEIEVNGKILMLKARAKALEQAVPAFNMNAFLTNNADKYYNPFTREALKWDGTNNQIYFEYNNGKKNVRVSL